MPTVMRSTLPRLAACLIAGTLGVTACGDPSSEGAGSPPPSSESPATTLAPSTSAPDTTAAAAAVAVVGVFEGVLAYPACGNEPFTHQGVTWYPVAPVGGDPMDADLRDRLEAILAVERETPDTFHAGQFARVPAPGPGDDVGTLVVWADGVGRWTSDSGDIDVWVVDEELTYNWVC